LLVEVICRPERRQEAKNKLIAMRSGERSYTIAARAVLADLQPVLALGLSGGE
jgi:hypothetical protein